MLKVWNFFLNVGLVYACDLFILWPNVSSHRSFFPPLSANLLLAPIPSPLSITNLPSRLGDILAACLQRVIKNLPCINIPISVLAAVLQPAHWLPKKHLIMSGSDGFFNFLVYLRQQQDNKLITAPYTCAPIDIHWLYCILQSEIDVISDPGIVMKPVAGVAENGFIC